MTDPTSAERFRQFMAPAALADAAVNALVVEACRIMDRLDQIDGIITHKSEWIQLMHFRTQNGEAQEVTVTLDDCLAEARQQSMALRGLLTKLGVGKADISGGSAKGGDPIDELARRRSERGAGPAEAPGSARRSR